MGTLISDDDSTLRANYRNIDGGGDLEDGIPNPSFLMDPSYRAICIAKSVFKLVKNRPESIRCIDALRTNKYFG